MKSMMAAAMGAALATAGALGRDTYLGDNPIPAFAGRPSRRKVPSTTKAIKRRLAAMAGRKANVRRMQRERA